LENLKRVNSAFDRNVRWPGHSFWDYSGGQMTNFGAHHLDITQWALGMDETGPVEVEGEAKYHPEKWYEVPSWCEARYRYANGVSGPYPTNTILLLVLSAVGITVILSLLAGTLVGPGVIAVLLVYWAFNPPRAVVVSDRGVVLFKRSMWTGKPTRVIALLSTAALQSPRTRGGYAQVLLGPERVWFTKREWAARSRGYWVKSTGIGLNMYITVFLGCLVAATRDTHLHIGQRFQAGTPQGGHGLFPGRERHGTYGVIFVISRGPDLGAVAPADIRDTREAAQDAGEPRGVGEGDRAVDAAGRAAALVIGEADPQSGRATRRSGGRGRRWAAGRWRSRRRRGARRRRAARTRVARADCRRRCR
jgi:hypothetical protein